MEPVLVDAVVVGAGQAGLSASYHLLRRGIEHVVLDAGAAPGGAWRERWPTLTMGRVNGVHDLPGAPLGEVAPDAPASEVVAGYFAAYESEQHLPVVRPVAVVSVSRQDDDHGSGGGRLVVRARDGRAWAARVVLNATGTWSRPFVPAWPGAASFAGRQLHTAGYPGPAPFTGQRVVVVGGGVSGVQLLLEVSEVATTTWVTRTPPRFRDGPFDEAARRAAVAAVARRVAAGEPPGSVVSVTGLPWSPELRDAAARGVLDRLPVPDRVVPDGLVWDAPGPGEPDRVAADVILWCTGFRAALDHLAPLHLRERGGGIAVDGVSAVREPRVLLLGYGPSASTLGANRAGREAARATQALLAPGRAGGGRGAPPGRTR